MAAADAQLSIAIPAVQVTEFVSFQIFVTRNDSGWSVRRRYQDFVRLHGAMKKVLPPGQLPELPGKTLRMGMAKFEPNFIEARRQKLEVYLTELLRAISPERNDALDDFLAYSERCLREMVEHLAEKPSLSNIHGKLRRAVEVFRSGGGSGVVEERGRGGDESDSDGDSVVSGPKLGALAAEAAVSPVERERELLAAMQVGFPWDGLGGPHLCQLVMSAQVIATPLRNQVAFDAMRETRHTMTSTDEDVHAALVRLPCRCCVLQACPAQCFTAPSAVSAAGGRPHPQRCARGAGEGRGYPWEGQAGQRHYWSTHWGLSLGGWGGAVQRSASNPALPMGAPAAARPAPGGPRLQAAHARPARPPRPGVRQGAGGAGRCDVSEPHGCGRVGPRSPRDLQPPHHGCGARCCDGALPPRGTARCVGGNPRRRIFCSNSKGGSGGLPAVWPRGF